MTPQKLKAELLDYLKGADNCISEDEEYIRGWKSAMLTAIELVEKLEEGK